MSALSKDSVSYLTVDTEDAGQRIDNWLIRKLKGVPKSHIYRIVRSGEVRVNKGRVATDYRTQANDVIRIPPVRVAEHHENARPVPAAVFPMVYEDDALLVINKPAGVAVHGGSGVSFGVIEQLRAAHPDARFLELVHRLDRETSGLLMLAKKRSALVKLHEMLRNTHPDKRYLALGVGHWDAAQRHVKLALHKYTLPDGERRVRVDSAGLASHTGFKILTRYTGYTLVEAHLKTGRTHQIRVHMQACGCPIAGDDKYGDHGINRALAKQGLKRMFLHASSLSLVHPLTGAPLQLEAALPAELQHFLDTLS